MSFFKNTPDIKSVVPIDFYELVIQFSNLEYSIFSPGKKKLYDKYSFMAYPNKLKAFKYDNDSIVWANGIRLSKCFFYDHSESTDISNLQSKYLTVGFKNQAPSEAHPTHDEYSLAMLPFNHTTTFVLSESIGGGHGERGGSVSLSLEKLFQYKNWKEHIEKADCAWAIDIIEQNQPAIEKIISLIVAEVCRRGKFD